MLQEIIKQVDDELKKLRHELRIELPKAIQKARELGDLSENAEYKSALERQSFVKARIGQLTSRREELAGIDIARIPKDRSAFGSTVTVYDLDSEEEKKFRLVLSEDADPSKGDIPISSPLGKGLSGKEEGDAVSIKTPGGLKRFEIVSVRTIHDHERAREKSS